MDHRAAASAAGRDQWSRNFERRRCERPRDHVNSCSASPGQGIPYERQDRAGERDALSPGGSSHGPARPGRVAHPADQPRGCPRRPERTGRYLISILNLQSSSFKNSFWSGVLANTGLFLHNFQLICSKSILYLLTMNICVCIIDIIILFTIVIYQKATGGIL